MEEQQQKSRLMVTPARLDTRTLRALEVHLSSQRHLGGYRMMHGGEPSQYFHPLWFTLDSAQPVRAQAGQLIGLSEPSRGLVIFTRGQSPTQLQAPESAAAPHIAGSGTPDANSTFTDNKLGKCFVRSVSAVE